MSWHGPSGDCGCCGGDCDPKCKCVVPICPDENNVVSFNTHNYEWLFYFSLTGRQDVNLFFDDTLVASIVNYFQDDILKYFIIASNLNVIEKFKTKKGSEGFCAIKELRNADYLLFDKSIMGKDSLNFKIRNLASEFLFTFLQGVMYDNTLEDFINALTVYNNSTTGVINGTMIHFQCTPICIDFDKDPNLEFVFGDIKCSVGNLFDGVDLEDLTGIVKTCGVDANGNTILAKKIVSSQLEILSSLGSITWKRTTRPFALGFGCNAPDTITQWVINFEEEFTGTYPGVFVDLLGPDPYFDPYDCSNNPRIFGQQDLTPYTQFYIDSVPISANFLDRGSYTPTGNIVGVNCPVFYSYNIEYKGYASLVGVLAIDELNGAVPNNLDFRTYIICRLFKYTPVDYIDVPFNNNTEDWIQYSKWIAHTDSTVIIRSGLNICPEKPFNTFPIDFGESYNNAINPRWGFNSVNLSGTHRHIGTGTGGGTQINPVDWDAQYIAQFIDPELVTRTNPVTTGTMYNGFKQDYKPYYCPQTYGFPCVDIPRDADRIEIDNNLSCSYTNPNNPSIFTPDITFSSSILVRAIRSAILENAG